MTGNYFYTAENEYAPALLHEFADWYANRHVPDIFRVGFQSAASYRAVEGGLNIFGAYDIPSPKIFHDPAYQNIGTLDPYREGTIVGRVTERAHTVYAQSPLYPAQPSGEEAPRLNSDWISVIRFAAPESADGAIARFFAAEEGARLGRQGARQLRLGRRKGERPASVTDRPACIIVGEWPTRPATGAETWRHFTERFSSEISDISFYVGYRVYPWRDDPTPV